MLTKTVKFRDLSNNVVEDTFYFNYRQSDLMKLHIIHEADGGYDKFLERVADSKDGQLIIDTFEAMVAGAVGKKGEDNRTFLQSPEITAQFMQSDAYSEFFTEIVMDAEAAGKFFSAVVPHDVSDKAKELIAKAREEGDTSVIGEEGLTPVPVAPAASDDNKLKDFDDYSRDELLKLTDDDFFEVVGTRNPLHMTKVQKGIAMQRRINAGK